MVRTYKRISDQQNWDSTSMERAIEAVRSGKLGFLKASLEYNVPKTTLLRRVKGKNSELSSSGKRKLGRFRVVFTDEQEDEIVQHVLRLEERFYGMTSIDLRRMAYDLAEKNNINHKFNKITKLAGEDWLLGFKRRHPNVVLRNPEKTSAARARAFNRITVGKFFGVLDSMLKKFRYPPHRIWNVDETGFTNVQTKSTKVLALKGRRQVGTISSAERGFLCTAVICMSAGGSFIPPLIIFPRARMKPELQDGAPPGSIFKCHESGWMQTDIFSDWFSHFLHHTKPTQDDPVLLILDGHTTHTQNLVAIEMAREHHVTLLCLPPHCSHKMQPLDVAFMGPLNTFYVQCIEKYLRNNPGRVVTIFQMSRIFGESYLKAAVPTTAINGFRKTGIAPFDPNVFSDVEFAPSETTDRPSPISRSPCRDRRTPSPTPNDNTKNVTTPPSALGTSSYKHMSPKELNPVPKVDTETKQKPRKSTYCAILTSSPHKNALIFRKQAQEEKIAAKGARELKKGKRMDKKDFQGETSGMPMKKKTKKTKIGLEMRVDTDVDDVPCMFCNEMFSDSRDKEMWVRCCKCLKWGHEDCAGVDDDDLQYTCDFCK